MVKPDLYLKDDTIYFVIPDNTKPIKVKYDDRKVEWNESGVGSLVKNNDRSESIEEKVGVFRNWNVIELLRKNFLIERIRKVHILFGTTVISWFLMVRFLVELLSKVGWNILRMNIDM